MSALDELLPELEEAEIGESVFLTIVEDLELLPSGEGILGLRRVVKANVNDGYVAKKSAVGSLVRTCKGIFHVSRRQEVIDSMTSGWEKETEESLQGILQALEHLTRDPDGWNLNGIKRQVARLVDSTKSDKVRSSAHSLLSSI